MKPTIHPRKQKLIELINGKTLDAGCGTGNLVIEGILKDKNIIGIDLSSDKINQATQNAINAGIDLNKHPGLFSVKDIRDVEFKENTFDTIIMEQIVEHLEQPQVIINRMLTFLKPNGKLYITIPNGFSHIDPDHKNFFFMIKDINRINALGMFVLIPTYFVRFHNIILLERFLKYFKYKSEFEEVDYNTTKQPQSDFFITITKTEVKEYENI